jgi:hypothetical protein
MDIRLKVIEVILWTNFAIDREFRRALVKGFFICWERTFLHAVAQLEKCICRQY